VATRGSRSWSRGSRCRPAGFIDERGARVEILGLQSSLDRGTNDHDAELDGHGQLLALFVVALAQRVEIEVAVERLAVGSCTASVRCGLVDHDLEPRAANFVGLGSRVGLGVRGHATLELGKLMLHLRDHANAQDRETCELQPNAIVLGEVAWIGQHRDARRQLGDPIATHPGLQWRQHLGDQLVE
jgi:hypothetical protein